MAARARAEAVDASSALAWLKKNASSSVRAGMARYGIPSTRAFGVSVGTLKKFAGQIGKRHDLALELWSSGWYEARLLAAFVAEPAAFDVAQMNAWAKDFDSWAVCDTVCFHAFDRTPLAWGRLGPWARARAEHHRRGAFALLWGLTVHDRHAPDERFLEQLPLIEAASTDERDYVKKGVDMALRALGKRNARLREAALELGLRLAASDSSGAAWIGRSVQRDLSKARSRPARGPSASASAEPSTVTIAQRPAKKTRARRAKAGSR